MPHDLFNTISRGGTRVPTHVLETLQASRIASGDGTKKIFSERAAKVKSERVRRYVKEGLLKKIDQMGDGAAYWLERLESHFKMLKPEGLMEGFEPSDFNDLWFVLTGEKSRKGADRLLFPGQEESEIDPSHNYRLGKIADRVAGKVASLSRHCSFYEATNGKWYMELADEEHGGQEDSTTYGPFESWDHAYAYLDNFSNPGSFWKIPHKRPIPTKSPDGRPIVNPKTNGRFWGR